MSFFRILQKSPQFVVCRAYATTTSAQLNSGAVLAAQSAKAAKKASLASSATAPQSSCPPDTILTGLNYLKGQPPVLALPDDQYPEWLWTTLEPKEYLDDGPGGKAERVKRKQENKRKIKERNFMSTQ